MTIPVTLNSEESFENEIQARGLTAPRLKPEDIDKLIVGDRYFVDDTLVICVLTLTNGHKVVGTSRPVSATNFDEELGREAARRKARDQIWELAGYELRTRLQREHVVTKAVLDQEG